MEPNEPVKITITVVSGKNLQSKKKGEVCRASVVFGFGKDLFQTEEIESNEPFWNQEAHVNVNGKINESLTFKLKDQGHTIGIITLPISSLTKRKHEQWLPFKPYKKEKVVHGQLCVNCYISEFRSSIPIVNDLSPSNSHTSSSEDISPSFKKSLFHRGSPLVRPSSESDVKKDTLLSPPTERSWDQESSRSRDSSVENNESDSKRLPEVSGISPSQGSTQGNERVILRGNNLGESRADITRVILVDIDCTSTLEYFSCGKLAITTLPRSAGVGSGPVTIETYSGGLGVSSLHYTYVATPKDGDHAKQEPLGDHNKHRSHDHEFSKLQDENRLLKQQLKELKDSNVALNEENAELKLYVEKLLSTIMEYKPELLDIARKR